MKNMISPCILYPSTSYKIAKTIHDVSVENLSLLIMCDWRGFSGGTRDMYGNVLDFGSMIVSELSYFNKNNIYIYVPPNGQLRGGSMVVFSKSINKDRIHFITSRYSKINVLEPDATKELKFKKKDEEKYIKIHSVSSTIANEVANMYTKLNDIIPKEHNTYILNEKKENNLIIDKLLEPIELREYIIENEKK